jgi:hypothetical protein
LHQHGFFFSGHCERESGSLCGLGCLPGYRLVDGDSFRECQQNGTWTGHQPKCEGMMFHVHCLVLIYYTEIRCSPLKINTEVIQECLPEQNSTDLKFGTKCRARCGEIGYRFIGPHVRECLILGIWSGYEQFCVGKKINKEMKRRFEFFLVDTETTTYVMTNTTSLPPPTTTVQTYHGKHSQLTNHFQFIFF